jgi:hypothetical protein
MKDSQWSSWVCLYVSILGKIWRCCDKTAEPCATLSYCPCSTMMQADHCSGYLPDIHIIPKHMLSNNLDQNMVWNIAVFTSLIFKISDDFWCWSSAWGTF